MTEWLDAEGDPLPEHAQLKPARLKWLIIFLISLGFVAIAVWVGEEMPLWQRVASGGFFALCGAIALPQMIGVGARLVLDPDGFTCYTLGRSFRRRWVECSAFTPVQVGGRSMVGFSTAQDECAHPRLAGVARAMTGHAGALPDTFGMSAADLSDYMNRFRARAMALRWKAQMCCRLRRNFPDGPGECFTGPVVCDDGDLDGRSDAAGCAQGLMA